MNRLLWALVTLLVLLMALLLLVALSTDCEADLVDPAPAMSVDCAGYPHVSCVVVVNKVDERPLVLEVITALTAVFRDSWSDLEVGTWGVTVDLHPVVPCFLGRPYARFYLKGLQDRPQDAILYGSKILEAHCMALPFIVRTH